MVLVSVKALQEDALAVLVLVNTAAQMKTVVDPEALDVLVLMISSVHLGTKLAKII